MRRYVVLLKGVNLGGRRKVPMADLRALLGRLGLTDVRTLLNSGNAIFGSESDDPAELEVLIAEGIEAEFGKSVPCLVRTGPEMRAVVEGNPLGDVATNGSRLMAHFLSATPDPALRAAHDPAEFDPTVGFGDRVIYQWCPDGLMAAPFIGAFVEKHLGVLVSARNWNTVTKLDAMLDS